MNNNVNQILKENLDKLPKDVREAILAVEFSNKVGFISKKYNLHIDQSNNLLNETVLLMLGLTYPENFINNLISNVEIEETQAREIAKEVNAEIFVKIKESLKKIHEIGKEKIINTSQATSVNNDVILKREDILKDLEKPDELPVADYQKSDIKQQGVMNIKEKGLVESKLEGTFDLPKTESEVEEPLKNNSMVDPYREPIE